MDYKVYSVDDVEDRLVAHEYKSQERIKHDLVQINNLTKVLDDEHDFVAIGPSLLLRLVQIDTTDSDKKTLDLFITYLRFVHGYECKTNNRVLLNL